MVTKWRGRAKDQRENGVLDPKALVEYPFMTFQPLKMEQQVITASKMTMGVRGCSLEEWQ